nr:uncharacterized protein LOC107452101 isoform X1 [Parasteatoda tepidariorum]
MEVKFILYVNRSIALSENSLNEKDIYDLLISSRDKIKHSVKEWKDVSFTIKNADFCFEENVMSAETGYGKVLKWKGTVQTKHAVSEPLCLNGWKLQTRVCRPSLTIGADWLPFNYSTCTKFQHSIKDLEISCSGDFKTSNQGLCYKLHHSLQSWDEALETCSNVSSYLIDFNTFREIASASSLESSSYWLPVKIYPSETLFVGMNSENKWIYENNQTSSLRNDEIVCAVAKVVNEVIQYDLASCDAKMPFICIHHPLKVLEAFMFTKQWHKIAGEESCYHIESTKKTWAEANESCSSLPFNTSLLQSMYSWHKYSFFKILLQATPVNKVSSWWMDLIQEGNELQSSHDMEFVDWKAGTNFNLSKSAGLITQDSKHENKMKWTLKEPSSKESSICELRTAELMEDNGPTHAYIEDRTLPLHSSTNFEESISKFDFRCVPSGWFLLNSISWYKDGDYLSPGFNTSRLTLFVESHSNLEHILSYQGYYWCSVDQLFPLKRIYSPKVLYRMPGVHTFILALYMDEDLQHHSCFKVRTETQLPPDFLQFFKDELPESFLHAQIRSKSCDNKDLFIHLYFNGTVKNENIMLRNIQTSFYLHRTAINAYLKKHFNTSSFLLRSTVRCSEEQTLVSEMVFTWPTTPLKQFAVSKEMCTTEEGIPLKRQCMGDFSVGAFWAPVKGNCVPVHSDITIHLHRLASNNITEENILNSSISFLQLTTNPNSLNSADIHYASQILKNMADVSSIAIEVLDNIVSTLDHLIQAANAMQTNSLSSSNVSNELIASYDSIVSRIETGDQIIKFARNNIALSIIPLNTLEYRFTTGGILEDWNMNITTLYNGSERQLNKVFGDFEAGIVLPDSLVVEKYAENTSKLAVTIQQSFHFVKNIAVVSPLIAVSLGNRHIYDVNPPIEMIFKIHEVVDAGNESEYKCAYWDEQLNENFGGWSYKGCFSQLIHDNQMQCLCDHLTSFAVILELKPGDQLLIGHEMTLSIITYIGCILSILGLGIIILTFVLFRKWRKELKNKALFNLSLALISFLIIFLAGIESKNSQSICLAVAICLHFFMLASFAWMLVEALVQYLSFVKVIGTYIPCFMQKAVAFAWGTPLLIVITVSSINYEYYTSRDKYCWLSGDMFYYAVATPVLSMLILNFLIFIIILYSNTCGRPSKRLRSNRDERKEAITTARAMFCVSVLLGLSWIFGFLAVDGAKLLFQYLFALFTTLQGFFMCVFFVFRQKSTRELWFTWITQSPTSDSSRTSHITDITNRAVSNLSRQSTPNRLSKAVYKTRLSYILFN